ncbi:hypothetical protein CDAR_270731 [Caerostris darwini]|uniref:Uncharacterized protein n=1 Tax=Caerostris darwini TaxID=1538125 RepID=A0AAV4TDV7_9ARAC|nr:hypothetical protein CDAR_270731 [Caerostris darwini]
MGTSLVAPLATLNWSWKSIKWQGNDWSAPLAVRVWVFRYVSGEKGLGTGEVAAQMILWPEVVIHWSTLTRSPNVTKGVRNCLSPVPALRQFSSLSIRSSSRQSITHSGTYTHFVSGIRIVTNSKWDLGLGVLSI